MTKGLHAIIPLGLALAAAGAAQAQTPPVATGPTATRQDAARIDDVIVTAQRRSQNLQDVPITMNVMGAAEVEQARIVQVSDVANRTVGLNFDAFPASQPRPAIRGIGSSDRGAAGDPSTAVFIDEVYMGRPAAVAFDAFDVARIEVLKGPQGTLWGKNVVGGAIHVVNQSPSLSGFDTSVAATLGNYDRLDVAGFANLPLGDTLALRLSASSRTHDGYVRNTYLDNRVEDQDTKSLRAQLLFQPSDNLSIVLGVDGTRDRATAQARHTIGVDPASGTAAVWRPTIDRDRDTTRMDTNGYDERDTWGVRLGVDWTFDDFVLSSISSWRRLDYNSFGDGDGGNPTTNVLNIRGDQIEETSFGSQELRLSALPGSRLGWVVGAYYFHADTDRTDIFRLDSPPQPSGTFGAIDRYDQSNITESVAAFADATWTATDRFNIFGGLRWSKDEKDYDVSNAASTALLRARERFTISASDSWDELTYRIGGDYQLADHVMAYGVISSGFKSGGFQDTATTGVSAATPFSPETATNYEIGLKAELFDRALLLNPSLFWTDYTDLQVRRTVGFDTITTNAGSARIKGFELTSRWEPVEGLSLGLAYAWNDARFEELIDNGRDFSGNRLTRNPEHKWTFSPAYERTLASGAVVSGAVDVQYESFIFDDIDNNALNVRPAKMLVDARLGFTSPDGRWEASLWGKNLGDEVYITHQYILTGGQFALYGEPRTFGATVRWRY
ncbi:TonB-dependent receptor [Brevundimonas sp.]|uniref:TonB-dependent receptor n=1 Tax=Brevundimonas sp. TaxID=1871086 RepID=UPI002487B78A|nr:TonB-dependent receptor [Brevundimonas sp.]MDI1281516.1 TonB-dependent receptor [Brevundimonas sp.]